MDTTQRLTPEEFAQIMLVNKPYLIQLEQSVEQIGYGAIEIKLYVRAGVVEKMELTEVKTWLKDKALDSSKKA